MHHRRREGKINKFSQVFHLDYPKITWMKTATIWWITCDVIFELFQIFSFTHLMLFFASETAKIFLIKLRSLCKWKSADLESWDIHSTWKCSLDVVIFRNLSCCGINFHHRSHAQKSLSPYDEEKSLKSEVQVLDKILNIEGSLLTRCERRAIYAFYT